MTDANAAQDLIEEFALFDDWEDRYRHLISLGAELPTLAPGEKTDATRVPGCASQVWLVVEHALEPETGLVVRGDSDAHIVKGLAAILARLYHGRSIEDAAGFDAASVFEDIGLAEHLTAQRANGLRAMIARIQAVAAREAKSGAPAKP